MKDYKFGVYITQSFTCPAIGLGFASVGSEKYLHIDLLFWEIAIGRTS